MNIQDLEGPVAIISPHLDDAVFSCGALMTHLSFIGIEVKVVTVFAGDPDCEFRAGIWDERAGFLTAGGATRARRLEDEAAVSVCGAIPVWLPFLDDQYRLRRDAGEISDAISKAVAHSATILVPGWPLSNPDHWWAAKLGLDVALAHQSTAILYAEEPYRTWLGPKHPKKSPLADHDYWVSLIDEEGGTSGRKRQAMRHYETQLELLASEVSDAELGGSTLIMSVVNAASDPGEFYAYVAGSRP